MKTKIRSIISFFIVRLIGASVFLGTTVYADFQPQTFATPEEAVKALSIAAASDDIAALNNIFGAGFIKAISSGDPIADKLQLERLSQRLSEAQRISDRGRMTKLLEVGSERWPFPAPLVLKDGRWAFNSILGAEEVINRRIGENELRAIKIAQFYVDAQNIYFKLASRQPGQGFYAQKFISTFGLKDGLYWETSDGFPSPLGKLVARAINLGYTPGNKSNSDSLLAGYYFRILKKQGEYAPGKRMNYVNSSGQMTEGFGLLAYPARWDVSGAMSFMVGKDGVVYEKNLGAETPQSVASLYSYNPDPSWHAITDLPVKAKEQKVLSNNF